MTPRSVAHGSFCIEKILAAPPARVFAAFTSAEAKKAWCFCDGAWKTTRFELDFRPGGREIVRIGPEGGPEHAVDAFFHEIAPNERFTYTYEMRMDETLISVSLATVEFKPHAAGTRLVVTEIGAFLDGHQDPAEREEGTRIGLGNLDPYLAAEKADT